MMCALNDPRTSLVFIDCFIGYQDKYPPDKYPQDIYPLDNNPRAKYPRTYTHQNYQKRNIGNKIVLFECTPPGAPDLHKSECLRGRFQYPDDIDVYNDGCCGWLEVLTAAESLTTLSSWVITCWGVSSVSTDRRLIIIIIIFV